MLEASLVILNANVITFDPMQMRTEAVAVLDDKIVVVGSNQKIQEVMGKGTRVLDAEGFTVIPGLVDCHVHMTDFGFFLGQLDLREARTISQIQSRLKEYAEKNPELSWIQGGRWDQEKLDEKRYPTRRDLDATVSDKPVFLVRVCGHIAVLNSKALSLAGITKDTLIDGGQVDLDEESGEPNGIVRENTLGIVRKVIPRRTSEELEDACVQGCQNAAEAGLTGVHWLVERADDMRAIQKLSLEGKIPLRVYLGISVELLKELIDLGLMTGFGSNMLKIGFIKILADGSLGARTAGLAEPYSDKPDARGMLLYSIEALNQLVSDAHSAGFQVAVHAIGDRAISAVLDAFEEALAKIPRSDHRHRIEHCSLLNPKLIERIHHLGITACVQPFFAVSDFWTIDRVGKDRARWLYPFRTLLDQGVTLVSGSDAPVEAIDPLQSVWAAVARSDTEQERLTVEEVLETYTLNAAYSSFDENDRGTISEGKLADFTVLSQDPLCVEPDKIKEIKVKMTIVGGKIVFSSGDFESKKNHFK